MSRERWVIAVLIVSLTVLGFFYTTERSARIEAENWSSGYASQLRECEAVLDLNNKGGR